MRRWKYWHFGSLDVEIKKFPINEGRSLFEFVMYYDECFYLFAW